MDDAPHFQDLYRGLKALAAGAFPKDCPSCGRHYGSLEEFINHTRTAGPSNGLKASRDEKGNPLVELYRNCTCGSTLMDFCVDRRDLSSRGQRRREQFDRLIMGLVQAGMEREEARRELRDLLRGQQSPRLETILQNLPRR